MLLRLRDLPRSLSQILLYNSVPEETKPRQCPGILNRLRVQLSPLSPDGKHSRLGNNIS
jgi:hypothetical protein